MATLAGKSYHHGDLRVALVAAARELVERDGTEGLTLRRAAARAGVSHTAAYRHFTDRADLVAAVMAQGFTELGAAVRVGSSLAELHAIGHAYLRFALANAPLYRLMFGNEVPQRSRHPELASAEQQVHDRMREAIVAAQREGVLASHDVDEVTVLMACVMHGLCSLLLAGQLPADDADRIAQTVMHLVDQGLADR